LPHDARPDSDVQAFREQRLLRASPETKLDRKEKLAVGSKTPTIASPASPFIAVVTGSV